MSAPKILIVEDEVLIAELIKDFLMSFGLVQILMAHNKKTAIGIMDYAKPDLVLLDLHLQEPLDGLELAKIIDDEIKVPYIFITANTDMLVIQEAVQTNASSYITKPIKQADLFAAIRLALKLNNQSEEKQLLVKDGYTTQKIVVNEIQYIESSGNYLNIYTKSQKHIARHTIEWVQEQLPDHQFMRIHRSFIVNLHLVNKVNSKFVFIDNLEIPISRTYLPKINEYLKN
jgi:two-component system, LytTR family, response regulator LytT